MAGNLRIKIKCSYYNKIGTECIGELEINQGCGVRVHDTGGGEGTGKEESRDSRGLKSHLVLRAVVKRTAGRRVRATLANVHDPPTRRARPYREQLRTYMKVIKTLSKSCAKQFRIQIFTYLHTSESILCSTSLLNSL